MGNPYPNKYCSVFTVSVCHLSSLVLHLTRHANPTIETIGEDAIMISNRVFPHLIVEADFLPGDYKGLLISLLDKEEDVFE